MLGRDSRDNVHHGDGTATPTGVRGVSPLCEPRKVMWWWWWWLVVGGGGWWRVWWVQWTGRVASSAHGHRRQEWWCRGRPLMVLPPRADSCGHCEPGPALIHRARRPRLAMVTAHVCGWVGRNAIACRHGELHTRPLQPQGTYSRRPTAPHPSHGHRMRRSVPDSGAIRGRRGANGTGGSASGGSRPLESATTPPPPPTYPPTRPTLVHAQQLGDDAPVTDGSAGGVALTAITASPGHSGGGSSGT